MYDNTTEINGRKFFNKTYPVVVDGKWQEFIYLTILNGTSESICVPLSVHGGIEYGVGNKVGRKNHKDLYSVWTSLRYKSKASVYFDIKKVEERKKERGNELRYTCRLIKNQKDYRKFKGKLQNDIDQLHLHQDSEDVALSVVIGKAILNFYKPKYEKGGKII
jgi:hypothetical protein